MPIKDVLEVEWIDELVDTICDKLDSLIPEWQVDPIKGNDEMDVEESEDYQRGYNKGIGDLKLMLDSIKDRQDQL